MRLCMMFRIDRGLVAISKDSRLIPQKKQTRHSHSRAPNNHLLNRVEKNVFLPQDSERLECTSSRHPGPGNTGSLQGLSVRTDLLA